MTKTQKERCKEFWDNYEGEKISFPSFYQTCRYRTEEEMLEAIKPKARIPYKYKTRKYTWAFPFEYEWFKQQGVKWISASAFLQRVRQWIPKEEAILTGEAREESRKRRMELAKPKMLKKYEPTHQKEDNPDYYWIPITYKKDEAEVFRKEYHNLLNTIEDELKNIELDVEIKQANEKLNKLKEELRVFNEYNR